jgi:hypothetical protein
MNDSQTAAQPIIAGMLRCRCSCCLPPQVLAADPRLDGIRMLCPSTGRTYLDRGDALFEADGGQLPPTASDGAAAIEAEPDVLSDRPVRSGSKTRIELERATFAGLTEVLS